jgi:hypothetical protein
MILTRLISDSDPHEVKAQVLNEYRYPIPWLWMRISMYLHEFESLDPNPDLHSKCGSGSRRAKITHKKRNKIKNFYV